VILLKVALLASEGGGISSVSFGLAQALSKLGVQTTIYVSSKTKQDVIAKNENFKIATLPILNYPPKSFWFLTRYVGALTKTLAEYDIIHAMNPELGMVYTLSRPPMKSPFLTTLHGSDRAYLNAFIGTPIKKWTRSDFAFHVLELPLHEFATKRCVAKSEKVIVPSIATLSELKINGRLDISKFCVISNGIDFNEIADIGVRENFGANKQVDELTMIYAGRLFWMKGIMYVLDAYSVLRKQFKNLRLRIFGKGPLAKDVSRLIRDRGFSNSIYFGGFLPHERLVKEVKAADVVLFPSMYESQPVFALEAMACKKPVIAFDLPSTREIVKNNKTGLLAKKGNLEDLCEKTSQVLDDKDFRERLGRNGYEYVRKNHDWNEQAKKYLKVYEEFHI
jgi:glycosyltransferase involved in cell wall biosynthesis